MVKSQMMFSVVMPWHWHSGLEDLTGNLEGQKANGKFHSLSESKVVICVVITITIWLSADQRNQGVPLSLQLLRPCSTEL